MFIFAPIISKFGGKKPFYKLLKDLSLFYQIFYFSSPIWPPNGVQGGQMGVKSHFCSNLHQIWWEEALFLFINGSFISFSILLLWAPYLTPRRGQGESNGGQDIFAPFFALQPWNERFLWISTCMQKKCMNWQLL